MMLMAGGGTLKREYLGFGYVHDLAELGSVPSVPGFGRTSWTLS